MKKILFIIILIIILLICIIAGIVYNSNIKDIPIYYNNPNYDSMYDVLLPIYTVTRKGKVICSYNENLEEGKSKQLNNTELKNLKNDLKELEDILKKDEGKHSNNAYVSVNGTVYRYVTKEADDFIKEITNKYFSELT